jgi:hypothetical protein
MNESTLSAIAQAHERRLSALEAKAGISPQAPDLLIEAAPVRSIVTPPIPVDMISMMNSAVAAALAAQVGPAVAQAVAAAQASTVTAPPSAAPSKPGN